MKPQAIPITENNSLLQRRKVSKDLVKIARTFHGEETNLNGFILGVSDQLVLIQVVADFAFDGYAIIRKDQIDSVTCNKPEKFLKKVLKAEGEFAKEYGSDFELRLINWQTVFTDLKRLDYHVIIEREAFEDTYFDIGPILRVLKRSVNIRYYDLTGLLEEGHTSIKYEDITIARFGNRYTSIFRKYLRS
jgi:hypothetical protein